MGNTLLLGSRAAVSHDHSVVTLFCSIMLLKGILLKFRITFNRLVSTGAQST
eukprot:SAG31_NODE_956_length_10790_cov_34.583107_2_plen_52_part_00